jgi:DNA-binding response OmpR family regulator
VLYISGYTEGVMDDQDPDDGGARLLSKPFGPDDLLAEVRRALEDRGDE